MGKGCPGGTGVVRTSPFRSSRALFDQGWGARVVRGTRFARASRAGPGADQLTAGVTRLGSRFGCARRSVGERGSAGEPGRDAHEHRSARHGWSAARRLFPRVCLVTEDGYRQVAQDEVAEVARAVVDRRLDGPNGPRAPVR